MSTSDTTCWTCDQETAAHVFADIVGTEVKNRVVVDYGCGIGRFSLEALNRGALRVIGVDTSHDALCDAQNYVNNPKFTAVLADASGPLADISRRADVVFSFMFLQLRLPGDVDAALSAMVSTMIRGGHISIHVTDDADRVVRTLANLGVRAHIVDRIDITTLPTGPRYDNWRIIRGHKVLP